MIRSVKIGNLGVGGKNPVRIKAMVKTPLRYKKKLIKEALALEAEGAEAIRIAIREPKEAKIVLDLKAELNLPFVADIHFHYKTALACIDSGFDSIRLNPLNIYKVREVKEVITATKDKGISIRIGVNSGGFRKKFKTNLSLAKEMVKKSLEYIKIMESCKFKDIMVSLKAADVNTTILANELFRKESNYPLHLGITASGPYLEAVSKSCVGLGHLLYQGVGEIIRVSLTGPSVDEVKVAKNILRALDLRQFGPQIISCPTCSRCEVDLISIVDKFKKRLETEKITKPLKLALMGCVVNGPGEATQADIGAAFGKNKAAIFRGNRIIKQSDCDKIIDDLINEAKKI